MTREGFASGIFRSVTFKAKKTNWLKIETKLLHAGIGPLFHGHIGFDKIQIGKFGIDTHSHAHYLHHKYFECNYADGAIPLDKIFGTFHNGSDEAKEKMVQRLKQRMKKMRTVEK